MNSQRLISELKRYLNSEYMFVHEEWLTGCVEYLQNDGTGKTYSVQELKCLARDQWLLNDLADICPGSLPPDLNSTVKTTLNSNYVLQVNYLIDVGAPAYQQLLKVKKVNTENIENTLSNDDKIPNHRIIKMYLTDGVQCITGIEYKTMRNLNLDLIPGSKMTIKGPITCRRGVLMLEEKHIKILGGEVDTMTVNNTIESVLSRVLGMEIDSINVQGTEFIRDTFPRQDVQPNSGIVQVEINENDDFNDEIQDDIDVDQLAALEEQIFNSRENINPIKRMSTPEKLLEPNINQIEHNKRKKLKLASSYVKRNDPFDYPSNDEDMFQITEFGDEQDCNDFMNLDHISSVNYTDDINFASNQNMKLKKVSGKPFIYIKQINELVSKNICADRRLYIKAYLHKLKSKIMIVKEEWSLKGTLADGSAMIDVDFSNKVLTDIVGHTPQEMTKMKKSMTMNPEVGQIMLKALERAKEKLQILNMIIELTPRMASDPIVTGLSDFTEESSHLLDLRIHINNEVLNP